MKGGIGGGTKKESGHMPPHSFCARLCPLQYASARASPRLRPATTADKRDYYMKKKARVVCTYWMPTEWPLLVSAECSQRMGSFPFSESLYSPHFFSNEGSIKLKHKTMRQSKRTIIYIFINKIRDRDFFPDPTKINADLLQYPIVVCVIYRKEKCGNTNKSLDQEVACACYTTVNV